MKKRVSKLLALALTATMLLSACGNNSGEAAETGKPEEEKAPTEQTGDKAEASADEIKDLVIARLATREIESFNILYSQTFSDFENLTNLTDPLYPKFRRCLHRLFRYFSGRHLCGRSGTTSCLLGNA